MSHFLRAAAAVLLLTAAAPAAVQAAAAAQVDVEIAYTMPSGWVTQPIQGGPDLKAHYAYWYGGRPYGEMYLSQIMAPAGQTLDQVFQDGLGRVRPQLPNYQARGTQRATVGGAAAVVHDFAYMPSGAGVMFSARTYTILSGATVFTFFFQTVSDFAATLQSQCSLIMATVTFIAKPAIAPAVNPVPPDPAALRPGGGLAVEDMGLSYDLPAGWRQVDDPMGAKYRCYGPGGGVTASLFIQKPEASAAGLAALFGASPEETLATVLRAKVDEEYKSYQGYTPAATVKRIIAGFPGLVHDFTFVINNHKVFYRWVLFAVPQKSDRPSVRVAPTIQPFAFLSGESERAAELARQWDAIIDTMQVKAAATPPAPPEPADKGGQLAPPPRPKDKTEGGLPDLQLDGPDAGLYAEPFGRYRVALPEGAVQTKVEDNAAYFRMPAAKTTFIIHSYRQEETGARLAARFAEGRKLNGTPSTLNAGERSATVLLYTARDAAGENTVWVVAPYPGSGLLIVVSLPSKDYAGAKDWISALLRGVRF